MRILVISNFYPPHVLGGYELGCRDVVDALARRGHAMAVLTSCFGVDGPVTEGHVCRWLFTDRLDSTSANTRPGERARLLRLQLHDQRALDRIMKLHQPDVVYVWNLAKLPISLAQRAESRGAVIYYVSDPWLASWTDTGWYEDRWHRLTMDKAGVLERVAVSAVQTAFKLGSFTWTNDAPLALRHVQFCSRFLREATARAGRRVEHGEVVHWGVDTARFAPSPRQPDRRRTRLLYVGQLTPHKGVHTAIDAAARLHMHGQAGVSLTIAGAPHDAAYAERLRAQVAASPLRDAITFLGAQSRDRIQEIYREHDSLSFPSCWDEPFAITPLEAMAAGLLVVGTPAGGSREVFEDGVNALTFAPGDAAACAAQLQRALDDPALAARLAKRGRETIQHRFTLDRMVDQLESGLEHARRVMNT